MGNQQLMLVVLGTIIVAVAVAVGVSLFRTSYAETMGDQMQETILSIAAEAREYYSKPATLGGGGKSFTGFQLSSKFDSGSDVVYKMNGVQGHDQQIIVSGRFIGSGTMAQPDGILVAFLEADPAGIKVRWTGTGVFRNRTKSTTEAL